ncbi:BBF_collapsed_G0042580.mRNA.1.CDS.1 [Saccharomyces cerevisiae]|nr:BBF_collapsed_G0042580.mRNA.1.CDS.1 [Saccharomyces cerevisiae]
MNKFCLLPFHGKRIGVANIPFTILLKKGPCFLHSHITAVYYSTKGKNDSHEQSRVSKKSTFTPLETPWYLRIVDNEKELMEGKKNNHHTMNKELEIPKTSPNSLRKIADLLTGKLGLDDFLVFDLRKKSPNSVSAVNKLGDFMVICTARSTKHCHKSFLELNKFLKHEFCSSAYVEGNFNERQESRRKRRLARKSNLSKLLGRSSECSAKDLNSEAWYMIDCRVDGIFVNILTQRRRNELNLEELYAPENEKSKFQNIDSGNVPTISGVNEISSNNNILLGLRRLAQQRRRYSTINPNGLSNLRYFLQKEDFKGANKIIQSSSGTETHNIRTLEHVKNTLKDLVGQERKVDVVQWKSLFDEHSTFLTINQSAAYWPLRLEYAILLNKADPQFYSDRVFLKDYLLLKKSLGRELIREDLIALLEMVLKTQHSSHSYFNLVKQNRVIIRALNLFKGLQTEDDGSVVYDEEVISLLLNSMVADERVKLRSLYETIDHIFQTFGDKLTSGMIVSILQNLAKIKDWNKLLQVWEAITPTEGEGQDKRPWNEFINVINQSGDSHVISKIVNNGHLLWIRRLNVNVTPELCNSIKALLKTAGMENSTLEEFLVRGTNNQ